MDQRSAHAFFVRDFAAWSAHDLDAAVAVTTTDVVMEGPAPLIPAAGVSGHAQYRTWLASIWRALPDLQLELDGPVLVTGDGTQAAAPWRAHGTMTGRLDPPGFTPTGQRVELAGVDVWRFRDGRGCRLRVYTDTGAVARQLGAMPARAAPASGWGCSCSGGRHAGCAARPAGTVSSAANLLFGWGDYLVTDAVSA